jgi:3',5'-cyclic AMP phosphodiesterase CpdA
MKLYAISDLHVAQAENRRIVEAIAPRPEDWLLIAGDVGETVEHLEWTLRTLRPRFAKLAWVPGNHELWTLPNDPLQLRGERRYRYLVDLCRSLDVLTPEDPYPVVECGQQQIVLAPLFLLYDYSFVLDGLTTEESLEQAWRTGVVCTDELFLHPDPYSDRAAWCRARVAETAARLAQVPERYPLVLVSHFPLRRDLAELPRIPEFALWCGTRATDDWHLRFRAAVVVSGHLHRPGVQWRDGVRFEEVSLGYPYEWGPARRPHPPHKVLPSDTLG